MTRCQQKWPAGGAWVTWGLQNQPTPSQRRCFRRWFSNDLPYGPHDFNLVGAEEQLPCSGRVCFPGEGAGGSLESLLCVHPALIPTEVLPGCRERRWRPQDYPDKHSRFQGNGKGTLTNLLCRSSQYFTHPSPLGTQG